MTQNRYSVDIAMMKLARPPDQLMCLGLGSCVGVAVYDLTAGVGGLIHVLLPSIEEFRQAGNSRTKFADSGITDLLQEVLGAGAVRARLKAKIAGGAAMFASENAFPGNTVGKRNVQSTLDTLSRLGINLVAQDTGGTKGRTIIFDVATGKMTVRMIDRSEKII